MSNKKSKNITTQLNHHKILNNYFIDTFYSDLTIEPFGTTPKEYKNYEQYLK